MPIVRRFEQNKKTLEEFYKEFIPKSNDQIEDIGTPMLEVLESINKMFKETKLYGLTSHATLLLFNNDNEMEDYFISIVSYRTNYYNEYRIEYAIPEIDRPWEGAMVSGRSRKLEKFEKMIVISIYKSGGWKNNLELEDLYQSISKNSFI